jgi:CubicO group peptidase (beta-lactamase class C family)
MARLRPALALLAVLAAACDAVEDVPARALELVGAAPPATRGLDSTLLAGVHARASELPRLRSLLVARHGRLEREWYFHGARADQPANIKSASKSVLSALIGIAIAEGHIDGVDQPIADFLADDFPPNADPRLHEITIGDLLSMRAGLESTSMRHYGRWVTSRNWVRNALARPFVDDPGGRMLYSTGNSHLLSAILTRATGMSTLASARSRLAEPLGIAIPAWTRDPQGIFFGGNEMLMTPRDLLRFGELYRNRGRHEGRQIVPEEWIDESWKVRTHSPYNGHGYGYGWWHREARGHDVHFAWGFGGQYIFIVPDLELTVVTTSEPDAPRAGSHLRALHDLLADHLIPAAEQGSPAPAPSRPPT